MSRVVHIRVPCWTAGVYHHGLWFDDGRVFHMARFNRGDGKAGAYPHWTTLEGFAGAKGWVPLICREIALWHGDVYGITPVVDRESASGPPTQRPPSARHALSSGKTSFVWRETSGAGRGQAAQTGKRSNRAGTATDGVQEQPKSDHGTRVAWAPRGETPQWSVAEDRPARALSVHSAVLDTEQGSGK